MLNFKPKIAFALGGGGARGLAHIGALKAFEKAGIRPDMIVGTSMGAIMGAAYAVNPDAEALEQKVKPLMSNKNLLLLESLAAEDEPAEKRLIIESLAAYATDLFLWNLRAIKGYIDDGSEMSNLIKELVDEKNFNEAVIKYACVATDINKGEEVIFSEGNMLKALMASSSIPGVFPPVEDGERLLIDGGIVTLLPAQPARKLGADIVIGINVDKNIQPKEFKQGYDIIFQADDIRRHELNLMKMKYADIIIEPDVKNLSWAHFSKIDIMIEKGEEAVNKKITEIKKKIKACTIKFIIKKFIPFGEKFRRINY
ncbi:MAG: patatin-like phospholipase family protein [Candidatus Omnitrophica bacterium]|nr:patatin-like phospholipase family protein [Candidatus Omnitrophota bacterium]